MVFHAAADSSTGSWRQSSRPMPSLHTSLVSCSSTIPLCPIPCTLPVRPNPHTSPFPFYYGPPVEPHYAVQKVGFGGVCLCLAYQRAAPISATPGAGRVIFADARLPTLESLQPLKGYNPVVNCCQAILHSDSHMPHPGIRRQAKMLPGPACHSALVLCRFG